MKPEIDPKPTIGRASVESQELIKFLNDATIGQVFTYAEMNEAVKADVQARNNILQTARRNLLRDKGYVFGTIQGVGIKRLSDEEIPDEGVNAMKRSRRIARNGMKKLSCANLANMTPETKVKAITTKTVLGLFAASGSKKTLNLAEQSARTTSAELKIGDVSALFSK